MAYQADLDCARKSNRSLDRRRETSRYAARDRRGKEADIFTDLKDVVPVVEESTVTHVDRIALLRVASTLCRMRKNAGPFLTNDLIVDDNPNVWNENTLSECLDGFVIMADNDGTMLYITESVSIFLGLTQTDLIGRTIKDFIYPSDYDELMRLSTEEAAASEEHRSTPDDAQIHKYGHRMIMRIKTVISPRGRNLNLKSALYKAIVCRCRSMQFETGKILLIHASTTPAGQGNSICMTNASVKGSETTSGSFMTRHTCDMRFSYVSENFNYLLRHESRSLMGTSFYDLVHPADLDQVSDTMRELFRKGHCRSPYYRLIGANNSVAWVQTEATTVNHTTRGQKGQYVLCVHSLVGMQSDIDSWTTAGTVCSDVLAAAQPACQFVKAEIDDVAEYLGRQPQFIDCYDFTPLIDSDAGINMNEYRPMRDLTNPPLAPVGPTTTTSSHPSSSLNNPPRRKDSYNEVLEWLFRDQPGSPVPNSSHLCEPQPQDQYPNGSNALGGGNHNDERLSYPRFGNQLAQQQYKSAGHGNRGRSIEGRREGLVRMGGGQRAAPAPTAASKHHRFFPRGNSSARSASIDAVVRTPASSRPRNCSITTSPMDDANRFANRAPMPSALTRAIHEDHHPVSAQQPQYQGRGGRVPDGGRQSRGIRATSAAAAQGLNGFYDRAGETGYCALTAGFADFGVQSSPEEVYGTPTPGAGRPSSGALRGGYPSAPAPYSKTQNGYSASLSTLPTSDFNAMPDARQCNLEEPRFDGNPSMSSPLLAPGSKRNALGQQPAAAVAAPAVNVNQLPIAEAPQQISREFFEEFRQENPHLFPVEPEQPLNYSDVEMCNPYQQCSSESFEALAPFVPEEDILQLNSEPFPMDINFPELDLSSYTFDNSFAKHINQPNHFASKYQSATKSAAYNIPSESQDFYNPGPAAKRARVDDSAASNFPPLSY